MHICNMSKKVPQKIALQLPPAILSVLFWHRVGRSRYYQHGLEDEDFLSAFEAVRSVEREYDGLAKAFGGSGERTGW